MPVAFFGVLTLLIKFLVVRMIISSGMVILVLAGYSYALIEISELVVSAVSEMPEDLYNLFLYAGFGRGIGYLFGAFSFRLTMDGLNKIAFR